VLIGTVLIGTVLIGVVLIGAVLIEISGSTRAKNYTAAHREIWHLDRSDAIFSAAPSRGSL
jgi:hypothetical protein